MKRRMLCLLFAVILLFSLASCAGKPDFPVTVKGTDIGALPVKVVSLSPLTTEMMDAIGAAAHLVGRSDFCDAPPSAASLPSMGSALNPDVDAILQTDASLVLTPSELEAGAMQRLSAHGIAVLCIPAATGLEEVRENYIALATAMGGANQGPANGERAFAMLSKRLQSVTEAVKGRSSVRACYLAGDSLAAPHGSIMGALLQVAGAANIAGDADWSMSKADIAAAMPEVIFCAPSMAQTILQTEEFTSLPAVQNGRVVELDSKLWERQGLRLADAAAQIARSLYPDAAIPDAWETESVPIESKMEAVGMLMKAHPDSHRK